MTLRIFDASGRVVRTLLDGNTEPGAYATIWDGRDETDTRLPSGVYFARMDAGSFSAVSKMTLLR